MKITNKLHIPEKHILIIGNRSYKNLGDELILLGTVKILLKQGKTITIAAYDPDRLKKFFSQFIDTERITFVREIPKGIRSRMSYIRQGRFKERRSYRKADAVIIGGGEVITEENKHSYRYRLVSLLPCLRKPRYIMGGIQVPQKRFNRIFFTAILKRTKYIFARDMESVHEIKKYGFDDIGFFMDTSYFAYNREKVQESASKLPHKKFIAINLNKNAERFLPEIIKDVKKFYNQGYEVMYIPVAKGKSGHYDDVRYARKIQTGAGIKDQRFSQLDWEKDFKHFATTLAQASMVISSRLHLFLVANFLGVPTKVYPYQKKILKMQDTLKDINL